jgi:hypothetical protein
MTRITFVNRHLIRSGLVEIEPSTKYFKKQALV